MKSRSLLWQCFARLERVRAGRHGLHAPFTGFVGIDNIQDLFLGVHAEEVVFPRAELVEDNVLGRGAPFEGGLDDGSRGVPGVREAVQDLKELGASKCRRLFEIGLSKRVSH